MKRNDPRSVLGSAVVVAVAGGLAAAAAPQPGGQTPAAAPVRVPPLSMTTTAWSHASLRSDGYMGPGAPPGPYHHNTFELCALDGHVLGKARLVARFHRN